MSWRASDEKTEVVANAFDYDNASSSGHGDFDGGSALEFQQRHPLADVLETLDQEGRVEFCHPNYSMVNSRENTLTSNDGDVDWIQVVEGRASFQDLPFPRIVPESQQKVSFRLRFSRQVDSLTQLVADKVNSSLLYRSPIVIKIDQKEISTKIGKALPVPLPTSDDKRDLSQPHHFLPLSMRVISADTRNIPIPISVTITTARLNKSARKSWALDNTFSSNPNGCPGVPFPANALTTTPVVLYRAPESRVLSANFLRWMGVSIFDLRKQVRATKIFDKYYEIVTPPLGTRYIESPALWYMLFNIAGTKTWAEGNQNYKDYPSQILGSVSQGTKLRVPVERAEALMDTLERKVNADNTLMSFSGGIELWIQPDHKEGWKAISKIAEDRKTPIPEHIRNPPVQLVFDVEVTGIFNLHYDRSRWAGEIERMQQQQQQVHHSHSRDTTVSSTPRPDNESLMSGMSRMSLGSSKVDSETAHRNLVSGPFSLRQTNLDDDIDGPKMNM